MEHRQPPLRATAEQAEHDDAVPHGPRRFSRFVAPPSVRRVALPRVVLAALSVSGVVITLGALGTYAARAIPAFLHRQPVYQFRFEDIVLDPPPPSWYRGGSSAFLARMRNAKEPQPGGQSVLDLDLARLADVFRLDPWVARVSRIVRAYPNRVVVRLVYRQPVARVVGPDGSRVAVLDAEGVVLSEKEIDPRTRDALIAVSGVGLPARLTPGETWKRAAAGGELEVDEVVVRTAALAGYLASVQHELERRLGEGPVFAVRTRPDRPDVLWVTYGHRWFFWGMAPGFETPESIKAAAKWEMLRDWLHESPPPKGRTATETEYYLIRPTGIEFYDPGRNPG